MTKVEIVHAVYTRLENRPGSLERAARALAEKHINIDAMALETNGGEGYVRIMTHKAREAVDALHKASLPGWESTLAVASIPNRAGELARATTELAAAGLNVESVVTTTDGRLAFRTNDVERAAEVLRKL